EKVVAEIKKVRPESDFIVILPHWGVEYARKPTVGQIKEARMFIDAGADLIIGTHPHVIETIEEYKGKYIFYSLGNFIFDQYFSVDTMQGLAVGASLKKQSDGVSMNVEYRIYPITINKYSQAELASEAKRKEILEWLSKNSEVSESVKEEIKNSEINK
ncbi:MAG: CapA family protein, partial [Candidatus Gracilibacteria bacterium]